jgi:arginine exporter protein ArgO
LRDEYVLAVVLICALSDTILIAVGVTSFGEELLARGADKQKAAPPRRGNP